MEGVFVSCTRCSGFHTYRYHTSHRAGERADTVAGGMMAPAMITNAVSAFGTREEIREAHGPPWGGAPSSFTTKSPLSSSMSRS